MAPKNILFAATEAFTLSTQPSASGSDARICKTTHQFNQSITITRIRGSFARFFRPQFFHVLGQNGVRKAGTLMMNAVKWFVKERESNQSPHPTLCDDAPGCAIYRVARHSDVLDVFAPVLQVGRQDCRHEIQPKKIFPQAECCGCPQDQSPRYDR